MQIKFDTLPKNEVCHFMENLCPFCAAEFVDKKNAKCNDYTTYTY